MKLKLRRQKYYADVLYLKAKHKGGDIWTVNEAHLDFMERLGDDKMTKRDLSSIETAQFDSLPEWIRQDKDET